MRMKGPDPDDKKLEAYILETFQQLKETRRRKEPIWKDITDYIYPKRSGWDWEENTGYKGEKIFDGVGIAALSRLADGLFGWMCSPSIDWLSFRPEDRRLENNKKVMTYARDLETYMYDLFQRTNFYDSMAEDLRDGAALGTAVMYVDESDDTGRPGPVYIPLHLRECYISENRYGVADILYREFEMTARQIVDEFSEPGDTLPPKFVEKAKRRPEDSFRILHACYPRGIDGITKQAMPYASHYLLLGGSSAGMKDVGGSMGLIRRGGLKFRRFEAWRFEKASGEVYGNCPGMDSIYDVKMQNIQAKTMADVAQLAARPPMQAPESMRGKINIKPAGIIYHNGEQILPLQTSFSYPLGIDAMQRREQVIREHFKTDFFMSISQMQNTSRERTREEVLQVKAESAAILGAVVGRIQSERLDPIIRMTLAIEAEAGRLPPLPDGVPEDLRLKLHYTGPLAMAQRKFLRTQGINQGLGALAGVANIFGPDVLLNIEANWTAREVVTANGFPYEGIKEQKQVEQEQAQAAQARAEAQQAAMQLERDKIMAKSGAAPEPGSPLSKAMGGE